MARFTVTIILSLMILALLIAGGWWLLNYQTPAQPVEEGWLNYENKELGLAFSYPTEYEVVAGSPLTLQAKYPSQAQLRGLWPITIRLVDYPTATTTFADYAGNLEENLILDLAWTAHQDEADNVNTNQQLVALEQVINEEVLGYQDKYSFKDETINSLNALIHSRSIYTTSRPLLEAYFDWGNKVLVISSEADNTLLDRLYHSVKKI